MQTCNKIINQDKYNPLVDIGEEKKVECYMQLLINLMWVY